jgi:DNA-binding response OmpR family regulator
VEDDELLGQQMLEAFQNMQYWVQYATCGGQALSLANDSAFDLCLVDYKLCDMVGTEVIRKIKARQPKCHFLILSGKPYLEKIMSEDGTNRCVEGIIAKPFSPLKLFNKIEEILTGR